MLLTTALVKLVSALQGSAFLYRADPVFPMLIDSELLCIAGLLEVAVAVVLFLCRSVALRVVLLVSVCNLFVGYRLARWIVGGTGHCLCLGYLGQWLHLRPIVLDWLGYALLAYLVCAAYYCAYRLWSPAEKGTARPTIGEPPRPFGHALGP